MDSRLVVVVAHPDDEVIGCGALLATLRNVLIVQVTDGAPRGGDDVVRAGFTTPAEYAAARLAESLSALAMAGIAATRLINLGVADQEAPDHLGSIVDAVQPLIAGADLVLTHAYEGGHGDHDAVAFAVAAAVRRCEAAGRPAIVEMPFYHAAPDGWVRQRFLPDMSSDRTARPADDRSLTRVLSPDDQRLKARMIAAHSSQAATLASFALDAERFRHAPAYDFTARPHDGALLYERHGWSLTWPTWQARVGEALGALPP